MGKSRQTQVKRRLPTISPAVSPEPRAKPVKHNLQLQRAKPTIFQHLAQYLTSSNYIGPAKIPKLNLIRISRGIKFEISISFLATLNFG